MNGKNIFFELLQNGFNLLLKVLICKTLILSFFISLFTSRHAVAVQIQKNRQKPVFSQESLKIKQTEL